MYFSFSELSDIINENNDDIFTELRDNSNDVTTSTTSNAITSSTPHSTSKQRKKRRKKCKDDGGLTADCDAVNASDLVENTKVSDVDLLPSDDSDEYDEQVLDVDRVDMLKLKENEENEENKIVDVSSRTEMEQLGRSIGDLTGLLLPNIGKTSVNSIFQLKTE